MTDDVAAQLGSFEYDNKQQLERVEDKIDAIAKAVGVPAPEVKAEPWQPMPVLEEVVSAPVIAAETAQLPPAALPDAHAGEASGILGGLAHKVADFAKGAVGGLRSDDVDALGNPDGGVPVAEAGEAPAVLTPIGSHTQALEERRAQAAPALAVAG